MNAIIGLAPAIRRFLLPLLLLASLLVCLYGMQQTNLLSGTVWLEPELSAITALVAIGLLSVLALVATRRKLDLFLLLAVLLFAVAAAIAGLGATATVLLQFFAAFCIGRRIYPPDGAPGSVLAWGVLSTAVGLAAQSFAVGLLALLPVNNPATYLLLLLAPILVGWRSNLKALGDLRDAWLAPPATAGSGWLLAFKLLLAFSLLMRLLAVLHPELGHDALSMHLLIAEKLQVDGRFHFDVTQSIWAVMPMAGDWPFALANMLGGEFAARLANLGADALVLALIYHFCASARGALAGVVAALVYSATPLVYLETTSLFVENFWTLWVAAALVTAARTLDGGDFRQAAGAGLLLGTAMAAKVTTVFLAPFFFAMAAAWIVSRRPDGWRKLGAFSAVFALASFLPYTIALVRTGNPVFPFMNEVFRSPFLDATRDFENPLFTSGVHWKMLFDATFDSSRFIEGKPGALGVALLLLLPAALVHALLESRRMIVAAACSVLFVVLVFHFTSYLRYVAPVLPLFAVLIGLMVADVASASRLLRAALLLLVFAASLFGLYLTPNSNWHHRSLSLPAFAGSEAEQQYLRERRPERRVAALIDALPVKKVLWLGDSFIYGTHADVELVNWHGGWVQAQEFDALASADQLQRWLMWKKFDAIVVAQGFDLCQREFLCQFLDEKTQRIYQDGDVAVYLPSPSLIYAHELLVNPGFDAGIAHWNGGGRLAGAGVVRVSSTESLAQLVPVKGGASYLIETEARCTPGRAPYRAQVNWLGSGSRGLLSTDITVLPCSGEFRVFDKLLVAPPEATGAMVYATGHEPGRTVDIDRVSFRSR